MFRVQCFVVFCLLTLMKCRVSAGACSSTTQFACSNGHCIPLHKVNNTVNDCDDNSDEAVTRTCRPGDFICTGGSCVTPYRWIDGVIDCFDGSDEEKAIGTPCSLNNTWPKPCESSINNSVCAVTTSPRHSRLNTTCQCLPGWHTNELRMNCTKPATTTTTAATDYNTDTTWSQPTTGNSYCTTSAIITSQTTTTTELFAYMPWTMAVLHALIHIARTS